MKNTKYVEIKGVGMLTCSDIDAVKEMERRIRLGEAVDKLPVSIQRAIETLKVALLEDEGYRQTWVANIAMAIHDAEMEHEAKHGGILPHEWNSIFNKGAERFLDLLCR